MGNDGLPLFLQQRDELFLLRDKGVDLGGFAVEELNYTYNFILCRKRNICMQDII